MCSKHMELLVRAIFIMLVERWLLCDYLPNPLLYHFILSDPWNPQTYKNNNLSIKTYALSLNKEWKINIWGKIYIATSYEMM